VPDPIFILGISQRSGTNFLFNLLGLHPDCERVGPIWENFLLNDAQLLVDYADAVYRRWSADWDVPGVVGPPTVLLENIGDGLITFLNRQKQASDSRRLLTKTPSVENLQCFFEFFPRAQLLLVVRDGRAVTESGVRSFGWDYDWTMRYWASGARRILQLADDPGHFAGQFLIVKYEDLVSDAENTLRRVFDFLDLPAAAFDFAGALDLPVSGSSELIKQGEKEVHWHPVQKTADFDPLRRFAHWGRSRHERFNWIAGECQARLGYCLETRDDARWLWSARNFLLDRMRLRISPRLVRKAWRRVWSRRTDRTL